MKGTLWKCLGAAAVCGLVVLTTAGTARADVITETFGGPNFLAFNNGKGSVDSISTTGGFWEQQFTNTGAGTTESITFHLHIDDTLVTGYWENFEVLANGIDIGKFSIVPGETGELQLHYFYPLGISGPNFNFEFEMTSRSVPSGKGSVTLLFSHQPSTVTISGKPSAVPEPSSAWLLGTGMLGLFAFGTKRYFSPAAMR